MKNLFERFIIQLSIPYTRHFIKEFYETHPNRNNMLGLWQMCKEYKIVSKGVFIKDKNLDKISIPSILHVSNQFVIVNNIEDNQITFDWDNNLTTLNCLDFQKIWDGNALIIESYEDAEEPYYTEHFKEALQKKAQTFVITAVILGLTLFLFINNVNNRNFLSTLFAIVDLLGLSVCLMLMQKQLYHSSKWGDKLCSIFNKNECNNILDSTKSKIFGYTWSEIGLGYFIMHYIYATTQYEITFILTIINWCAMLFSFWSIYYQAFIAKQWCTLCIIVQALLITNGISPLIYNNVSNIVVSKQFMDNFILFGLSTLIIIFIIHFIAELISQQKKALDITYKYRSLKNNSKVFNLFLNQNKNVSVTTDDSSIHFGNNNAEIKITILTNPHCNPCARLHKKIESLLKTNNEKIYVQYIFCSFNEELKESARFLIAAYQQLDEELAMNLFSDWFRYGKDKRKFFLEHWSKINYRTSQVEEEMNHHERWKENNGFSSTPTIIINGYLFPREYEIDDIATIL